MNKCILQNTIPIVTALVINLPSWADSEHGSKSPADKPSKTKSTATSQVKLPAAQKEESTTDSNPKFLGADPDVILSGGKYWIYHTEQDGKSASFFVESSSDLMHWKKSGPIFKMSDAQWIEDDQAKHHELWAPGAFKHGKKFYLYYSVGPQNPTPSRIGIAIADSPEGPFKDSGKSIISGNKTFEAIDAMVFQDPKTNNLYLYCGGSAGAKLRVFELNSDLISIKKEIEVSTPKDFTEGAFMHFYNGKYYLSYSNGRWNDESYRVCYSTSNSPTGPWSYEGVILSTDEKHAGPGHHSVAQSLDKKHWLIIYHRWNNARKEKKMPEHRSVAIDEFQYDSAGKIQPIKMSN